MVRRVVRDTWKGKKWYKIIAPSLFKEVEVGKTVASDTSLLPGRTVEVTLKEITGDIKQSKNKLIFRITDVAGDNARTKCVGAELSRSYLRSLTRRRVSRVDPICDIQTKDGAKFRIKALILGARRMKTSIKSVIRAEAVKMITEKAKEHASEEFFLKLVNGEIADSIKEKLHKIYPLQRVEINKVELL